MINKGRFSFINLEHVRGSVSCVSVSIYDRDKGEVISLILNVVSVVICLLLLLLWGKLSQHQFLNTFVRS